MLVGFLSSSCIASAPCVLFARKIPLDVVFSRGDLGINRKITIYYNHNNLILSNLEMTDIYVINLVRLYVIFVCFLFIPLKQLGVLVGL